MPKNVPSNYFLGLAQSDAHSGSWALSCFSRKRTRKKEKESGELTEASSIRYRIYSLTSAWMRGLEWSTLGAYLEVTTILVSIEVSVCLL